MEHLHCSTTCPANWPATYRDDDYHYFIRTRHKTFTPKICLSLQETDTNQCRIQRKTTLIVHNTRFFQSRLDSATCSKTTEPTGHLVIHLIEDRTVETIYSQQRSFYQMFVQKNTCRISISNGAEFLLTFQ